MCIIFLRVGWMLLFELSLDFACPVLGMDSIKMDAVNCILVSGPCVVIIL